MWNEFTHTQTQNAHWELKKKYKKKLNWFSFIFLLHFFFAVQQQLVCKDLRRPDSRLSSHQSVGIFFLVVSFLLFYFINESFSGVDWCVAQSQRRRAFISACQRKYDFFPPYSFYLALFRGCGSLTHTSGPIFLYFLQLARERRLKSKLIVYSARNWGVDFHAGIMCFSFLSASRATQWKTQCSIEQRSFSFHPPTGERHSTITAGGVHK